MTTTALPPWRAARLERAFPTVDGGLFEPVRGYAFYGGYHRDKLRCTVCFRTGYPGGEWQEGCRRGHRPCPLCGRQLTVLLDGTPRKHARCPGRAWG